MYFGVVWSVFEEVAFGIRLPFLDRLKYLLVLLRIILDPFITLLLTRQFSSEWSTPERV